MTYNKHALWLDTITSDTNQAVGQRIGLSHASISRNKTNPTWEVVVKVARAYGADPVRALGAAGLLTESETKGHGKGDALKNCSRRELLTELLSREEPAH